uniref:Uncharacterized protein n=1 Tax=Cucumis melo TaxID=3656 RepID=A0A9I9EJ31_CUCME
MAFGASIEGWKYCRLIISVDGTFLKCKFGGILLTVSLQDAYTVNEFEYHMRCMKSVCPNIRHYQTYSRRRRYRMMTSNCAESVNSVFKDLIELPVAMMLSLIRDVLQKWFYERSKVASTMKSCFTSWAENILRLEHEKSRRLLVDPISTIEYKETLSATYNGCIQPVGSYFDWRVVDFVMIILPSICKRQARRPRKQRIPSVGKFSSSTRRSNCNCKGHNSRTYNHGLH